MCQIMFTVLKASDNILWKNSGEITHNNVMYYFTPQCY